MTHLQQFPVAFEGSKSCTFDGTKYYRLCFRLEPKGAVYSVKNAEDQVGGCGVVQFLKGGEMFAGKKIEQDCFTLVMITNKSVVDAAKEALAAYIA